ncbi:MAG: SEC-C domain-containing protein, partial [Eubacterium sp.]|nr:SEC-C domain-containing protein [Eubacterium sp.]
GGEDLRDYIQSMVGEIVDYTVEPITLASKFPEEWDFATMTKNLRRVVPTYRGKAEYSTDELAGMTPESLKESIKAEFERMYEKKEQDLTPELMREAERMILLRVVDNLWMDQIDAMDQLKEGIGLRALGQQDPVAAYAKEGFDMFEQMVAEIREETVGACYSVTVKTDTARRRETKITGETKSEFVDDTSDLTGNMPEQQMKVPDREARKETFRRDRPKVGRNDPCPCGSGKKYKNCCMNKDLEAERRA